MNEPRITIAIPVLNEEKAIRETLEAVCAQETSGDAMEILILDGGSGDGTTAIVQEIASADPRLRLLENPQRYQAAALNLALKQARGAFFIRVDARTRIAPDYVETCVQMLEAGQADRGCGPRYVWKVPGGLHTGPGPAASRASPPSRRFASHGQTARSGMTNSSAPWPSRLGSAPLIR